MKVDKISTSADRRGHKVRLYGVIGTIVYILLLTTYSFFVIDQLLILNPHDFAEYLSGLFGPLAFIWVVLGYYQQGKELRHSAEALLLQGEELKNSVEQQKELVAVSKAQFDAEIRERDEQAAAADAAAQPRLRLSTGNRFADNEGHMHMFSLRNMGPMCSNLQLEMKNKFTIKRDFLGGDDEWVFGVRIEYTVMIHPLEVELTYRSANGRQGSKSWLIRDAIDEEDSEEYFLTPQALN